MTSPEPMLSTEVVLLRLSTSACKAVQEVLSSFTAEVDHGSVAVVADARAALTRVPVPAVRTSVSYVDGATGANVFAMTRLAARRLAASMMGEDPAALEDGDLTELELSAVGEAMNQVMARAAAATSAVLGSEVEISPPDTRVVLESGSGDWHQTPYVTAATLTLHGEPCCLVQLVPNAFVVRLTRAFSDADSAEILSAESVAGDGSTLDAGSLRDLPLRLSTELGRTRMPISRVVSLYAGTVVELDRAADDPVDLYVNGKPFARGMLAVVEGRWAVRITSLPDSGALRSGGSPALEEEAER